jgi:transmembrane sensor
MQEHTNHITDLIVASVLGELSEEGKNELNNWANESPENRLFLDKAHDPTFIHHQLLKLHSITPDKQEAAWKTVEQKLDLPPVVTSHSKLVLLLKCAAAAVVVLVAGFALLFLLKPSKKEAATFTSAGSSPFHWKGPFKAMLILADGTAIELDESKKGVLAQQGNTTIEAVAQQLIYQVAPAKPLQTVPYNSVITPPGGQLHLVLPDGSHVWLNASSSIHFPTSFSSKDRTVAITGEAFFEVAAVQQSGHKIPFRVIINNTTEVEVLGTVFNINAYSEEPLSKTTLLEGKIKITDADSSLLIQPNQQVQVEHIAGKPPHMKVIDKADIDKTMAWRKGIFVFKKDNIATIGKEIKRWYNVEVTGNTDERFSCRINRTLPLDSLLSVLFKGNVGYVKKGNIIHVNP